MELIFPIALLIATRIIRYFMSFFSVIFDLVLYYFETISFFDKIINVASGRIDPSNKAIFITGKLSKPNTFLIYFDIYIFIYIIWQRKVHRIELNFFNSKFLSTWCSHQNNLSSVWDLIWENFFLFEIWFEKNCVPVRVLPLRTREGQPLSLLFFISILTHSSWWTCITFTVSVLIACQENSWDSHGENEC